MDFKPGDRVIADCESLGLVKPPVYHRFVEGHFDKGKAGTVVEHPYADGVEIEGWFYVEPDEHEGLLCPVAEAHVKKAQT